MRTQTPQQCFGHVVQSRIVGLVERTSLRIVPEEKVSKRSEYYVRGLFEIFLVVSMDELRQLSACTARAINSVACDTSHRV